MGHNSDQPRTSRITYWLAAFLLGFFSCAVVAGTTGAVLGDSDAAGPLAGVLGPTIGGLLTAAALTHRGRTTPVPGGTVSDARRLGIPHTTVARFLGIAVVAAVLQYFMAWALATACLEGNAI